MSIIESVLQGALIGGAAGGIAYAVRTVFGKGKSAPGAAKVQAANIVEENGTIAPVHIPDAAGRADLKPREPGVGQADRSEAKPSSVEAVGWLVLKSGANKGARYDLSAGEIKIGRSATCRIRINDDEEVSREHAMIRVNAQECRLCDLCSRNGTFLNEARVEAPRRLQEGDMIRIGSADIVFIRT